MIFFDKIQKIIDYYGIKSVNSFAKDYLKYKSSEKINRLKGKNTLPSFDILHDISISFEEINPDWLLTGRGEMLRKNDTIGEPTKKYMEEIERCHKMIDSLQYTIDMQKDIINSLKNGQKDALSALGAVAEPEIKYGPKPKL